MDLPTVGISLGVAFGSAVLVYVITVFTMKEKTYEEAIAEQRNLPEEKLLLGGSSKDKNKEKKQKKAVKKEKKDKSNDKEKSRHSETHIKTSTSVQKVHVDFGKPEAEVLSEQPTQDDSKKKKKVKVKPILVNKSETTIVAETSVEPVGQNHFEEILPKDDLLLKLKESREDVRDNTEKKVTQDTQSVSVPIVKVTAVSVKAVTSEKSDKLTSQTTEKTKKQDSSTGNSKENIEQNKAVKASPSKSEKVSEKSKTEEKKQVTKSEKHIVKNEKTGNKSDDKPKLSKTEKVENKETKPLPVNNESKVSTANEKYQANKAEPNIIPPVKTEEKQVIVSKVEKVSEIKEPPQKCETTGVQVSQAEPVAGVAVPLQKKKKKNDLATLHQMSGANDTINISLLMSLLRKAELSRTEVQGMIELLLNKQGSDSSHSEWIEGRQDPVVKLKKQLTEKEKSLAEEQEASLAFQNKLKELRSEYNAERSRLNHSCRQLEEALVAKQNESQALAARLQHTHDTAVAEKQQMSQQIQQLQTKLNEERLVVRKLQEEQAQSQNLQEQLLSQRQQLEMHISHQTEQQQEADAAYKSQIAQLHAQLQETANMNAEYQAQHEEKIAENKTLMERIACSENQIIHLEQQLIHFKEAADHVQDVTCQLEESQVINTELEHRLKMAQQREVELQFENNSLKENYEALNSKCTSLVEISNEANKLRSENEMLAEQLASLNDVRLETQRIQEENDVLKSQLSRFVELQEEVEQLREENESLAAQVTSTTERPAAEGRENGDSVYLEEKINASQAQQLTKEAVLDQSTELNKLSISLEEKTYLIEKLNLEIINYKTDISRLRDELEHQRSKNDELRKKNWKAMEALSAMEKSLQSKVKESQNVENESAYEIRLQQQAATRLLLQRIFPSIKIDDDEVHEKWIEKFEKEANSLISKLQSQKHLPRGDLVSKNQSSVFIELEKQNSQLTALVSHYKTIIDDTEGMLNKLQKHVEQEEARWRQLIQQKEIELEQLREERDKLLAFKEHATGAEEYAVSAISLLMQSKLQDFQKKLEKAQEEKVKLSSSLDAAYSECSSLRSSLQESELLRTTIEKLQQEKSCLTNELETERERGQKLSMELLNVKSISKTAKDFSFQEHEIVADLQQKTEKLNGLGEKYSLSSNGPAFDSAPNEGTSERK